MDFGRIQEAQERRRQELREAMRRAALLRDLDCPPPAARQTAGRHAERTNRRRLLAAGSPVGWLRAFLARARAWRRV